MMMMMMMVVVMKWLLNDWLSPQQVVHSTSHCLQRSPRLQPDMPVSNKPFSVFLQKPRGNNTKKATHTKKSLVSFVFIPLCVLSLEKCRPAFVLFCLLSSHTLGRANGVNMWVPVGGGVLFPRSSSQFFSTFQPISTEVNYLDIGNQNLR